MSANRGSRPRLDLQMKNKIKAAIANGKTCEEVAEELEIHVEYVRRIAKTLLTVDNQGTNVRSSPRLASARKGASPLKKRKVTVEDSDSDTDGNNGFRTPRKGKNSQETRVSFNNDIEMVDDSTDESLVAPSSSNTLKRKRGTPNGRTSSHSNVSEDPSRKSQEQFLADAALGPVSWRTTDRSTLARTSTANTLSSPCFKTYSVDACIQTDAIVFYDQEYIDFLQQTHQEELEAKENELEEVQGKLAATRRELEQTKIELRRERERIGFEKGWKKYF